jgi:predicted enzyme related to lactoylglutathione lyase
MTVQRFLFNIPSDAIERTANFYKELFGFEIIWRNEDWYIQLASPENKAVQFGIIRRNYSFLPKHLQLPAQGVIFTIQVDDVDSIYKEVIKRGCQVVQTLRDEDFGQRHFLMMDPNGLIVNVSMPIAMSGRFADDSKTSTKRGEANR